MTDYDDLIPSPSPCGIGGHVVTFGIPCNRCQHECLSDEDRERVERERSRP